MPRLEDGRTRRQLVELAADGVDTVEMRVEDGPEARTIRSADQTVDASPQAARLASEEDHEDEEEDDRGGEPDDRRADDGGDGGVQVDRWILRVSRAIVARGGRRESSKRHFHGDHPAAMKVDGRSG
jgi:hypothetical protein